MASSLLKISDIRIHAFHGCLEEEARIGTEFVVDGRADKAKPLVKEIIHKAEEKGLLLLSCGTYDNTIRWIPPLNVTEGQIRDGLQVFEDALKEVIK